MKGVILEGVTGSGKTRVFGLHRIVGALGALRSAKAVSMLNGRDGNTTVLVVIEGFVLGQIATVTWPSRGRGR